MTAELQNWRTGTTITADLWDAGREHLMPRVGLLPIVGEPDASGSALVCYVLEDQSSDEAWKACKARRNLILSARDLLEACRSVDDAFALYVDNASDPEAMEAWQDAKDKSLAKVRAAIAKATAR